MLNLLADCRLYVWKLNVLPMPVGLLQVLQFPPAAMQIKSAGYFTVGWTPKGVRFGILIREKQQSVVLFDGLFEHWVQHQLPIAALYSALPA